MLTCCLVQFAFKNINLFIRTAVARTERKKVDHSSFINIFETEPKTIHLTYVSIHDQ